MYTIRQIFLDKELKEINGFGLFVQHSMTQRWDDHRRYQIYIQLNLVCWSVSVIENIKSLNLLIQGLHYNDVIMGAMTSQITSLTIVYSTVYSDADQRKHQSSASLAFVRGIQRWPVNSPHKGPVTRKMFPLGDVIMGMCLVHQVDIVPPGFQPRGNQGIK